MAAGDNEPAVYLCLCAAGLEEEAIEGTRAFLRHAVPEHADACTYRIFGLEDGAETDAAAPSARRKVQQGTGVLGKVTLTAPRAVPVPTVLQLPFFICILALAGRPVHAVPMEKEAAMPFLEDAVRDADGWAGAMVTWAEAQDAIGSPPQPTTVAAAATGDGEEGGGGGEAAAVAAAPSTSWLELVEAFLPALAPPDSPSTTTISLRFRASVLREGHHRWKKMDALAFVGNGVAARLGPAVVVNLTQYDLEVVALIHENHLHVGLVLDNRRHFRSHAPAEPLAAPLLHRDLVATLRPSTAALLCLAARPAPGDVVCDVMCGVGTIPLVAATMPTLAGPVIGLGGDRDDLAIMGCAAKNYRSIVEEVPRGAAGIAIWDARRLPVRDGCLDIVIVDLPFGKKHKVKGGNLPHLYRQAIRECARAVRPGGRLLLLAAGAKAVEEALAADRINARSWRPWQAEHGCGGAWAARPLNVGGLVVHLFVLERTSTAVSVPSFTKEEEGGAERKEQHKQGES